MAVRTQATTLIGIEAFPVDVEAQVSRGLRRFSIVGLPDGVLRESKERIRCAVVSSGIEFPDEDVVVSLAPASLPKVGAGVELAIALAVLAAEGLIDPRCLAKRLFLGELALDGQIKKVPGGFAASCYAAGAPEIDEIVLPVYDAAAAEMLEGIQVVGIRSLAEAIAYLRGEMPDLHSRQTPMRELPRAACRPGFGDVVGQHTAKRALEIAAAGGHNVLMVGPPGCGKSMLASRLPSILPPLSAEESIEVAKIHSCREYSGWNSGLHGERPFRAPHHSVSMAGLIGGGTPPVPGEITLAHGGVLFMDELAEFRRDVLESLRQPLECRRVQVSRARYSFQFPAHFLLVAAMNPCPCGTRGDGTRRCRCSDAMLKRYFSRLSRPFLDRLDISLWVSTLSSEELVKGAKRDPTADMRDRVMQARAAQGMRFGNNASTNAAMSSAELKKVVHLGPAANRLLKQAQEQFFLSNRGVARVLKVARTIADLDQDEAVAEAHIAEAVSYRSSQFNRRL